MVQLIIWLLMKKWVKYNNYPFYMFSLSIKFIDTVSDIMLYDLTSASIISSHIINKSSAILF